MPEPEDPNTARDESFEGHRKFYEFMDEKVARCRVLLMRDAENALSELECAELESLQRLCVIRYAELAPQIFQDKYTREQSAEFGNIWRQHVERYRRLYSLNKHTTLTEIEQAEYELVDALTLLKHGASYKLGRYMMISKRPRECLVQDL